MNGFEIGIVIVYAVVLVVWLARHLIINLTHRASPYLTPRDACFRGDDPPLVSVIVPAKDEETSIGECLHSILNQSYLRLEVLVIDDRSQDRTANVVREIAACDPRVRLVRVKELPPGWTGKTNALATGVREARGDWFLFIDSDTRHEPENLSVLMEYARREQADMVSVLPRWRNETFWERVAQPLAALLLILKTPPHRVNNEAEPRTAFANGQYILIHRRAYEAVGGHAAVRDKFVEDIHLARVIKANGFRLRLARAPELTSTRMYTSLRSLVRGWSRILYAGYDFSALHLGLVLAGLVVFSLSGYMVLGGTLLSLMLGHSSHFVLVLLSMSIVHLLLQTTVMARIYAITACEQTYVAFNGLAAGIMVWVLGAALRKCFTHEVTWRGTNYHRLQDSEPLLLPFPKLVTSAAPDRPLKQSA